MRLASPKAVVSVLALTAATLFGFAGSAAAGTPPPHVWDHRWTTSGATLYVQEHGDVVSLCDSAANGIRPGAIVGWFTSTGWHAYDMLATGGNGSCKSISANSNPCVRCNIPEGVTVRVSFYGANSPSGPARIEKTFVNDH
jgi:hypothetical protein